MTDDNEQLNAIKEAVAGIDNKDCFFEREVTVKRLLADGATWKQIALVLRCTTNTARNINNRRLKRIEHWKKEIKRIEDNYLDVKENWDLRVAYTNKGAGEVLKLLLPHINEIKELCK